MKWLSVIPVLLAGCAVPPEPTTPPAPVPEPAPVVCTLPAGLTRKLPEPIRPVGHYTQRDVARYLTALHQWGVEGWLRLERVDRYSQDCAARQSLMEEE